MTSLLLDTHTLIWFFQDDPRISTLARVLIEDPTNRKLVSIATCWEIAIKVGLGKLALGEPTRPYLDRAMAQSHFELLPISLDHATLVRGSPASQGSVRPAPDRPGDGRGFPDRQRRPGVRPVPGPADLVSRMEEGIPGIDYTERMIPEQAHARTFWEHVARYRFARDFVRGRRVLDVACGEGYGAAAMARAGASSVVGVDISAEVCDHARRKYGLDARPGDAQALPLPDRSVDVVVSFETIEHVEDPGAFLRECARVLVPEGTLIVSTPNRPVYTGEASANPFHRVEFDEREFLGLLGERFRSVRLYSQFPRSAAWWSYRSLSAERSPWLRIKGFWRLSTILCPAIRPEVSPATRSRAVDLILGRDTLPSSLFNPYVVRERSERSLEQPYIFLAVAQGIRPD